MGADGLLGFAKRLIDSAAVRRCVWGLFGLWLTCLTGPAQTRAGAPGEPAAPWELPDAKGNIYRSQQFSGRPLLLVGADRTSEDASELWGQRLAERYGGKMAAIAIADLHGVPGFLRGIVRGKLQRRNTPSSRMGVPLLLDWEGIVAKTYHFESKVPNLLLIDQRGRVKLAVTGEWTAERMRQVSAAVEELLTAKPVRSR